MKKLLSSLFILSLLSTPHTSWARCGSAGCLKENKKACAWKKENKEKCERKERWEREERMEHKNKFACDRNKGCKKATENQCPLAAMFCKKVCFLTHHANEIGLDRNQLREISRLKIEVKKLIIKQNASHQILMLDLMNELHEDTIDMNKTNSLIDAGASDMGNYAKQLVQDFANLKKIVGPQQWDKMKEIWRAEKSR